jgi:hypothetical protein
MRHSKDRRHAKDTATYPLEDSNHDLVMSDRRKKRDRRLENMAEEEKQLLLSEMPWLTYYKHFR